jgi:transposase
MDITDPQWAVLEPLFRPKRRADGRGRPWQDTRAVLNGVFWVLRTGAPRHDLPSRYPPYQTCHRRFQSWQRSGLLTRLLQKLAEDLRDRGKLDLSESFIDDSFSGAKKGALVLALQSAAKAAKSWQSQTAMVFLSPCTSSASPHETKLVEPTLEHRFLKQTPERMIGDRAYDSDPLDQRIQERYGVQLIAPHKFVRVAPATQDGRRLRRYRRRWKIERLFAWLHNFRRTVIRWEYYPENFLGMVQLACAVILLRHL